MTSDRTMNDEHADQDQVSFRIGDVFPESDPVARFVAGIAMMANDWGRLFRLLAELRDDELGTGTRLLLYRLQLSFHVEAVKFLRDSERQYPEEIARFLESLPDEASELHRKLTDESSLTSLGAGPVRNQSFHYPRVHRVRYGRGNEEMAQLLSEAADLEGKVEVSADNADLVEYGFADEIIVQLLPSNDEGRTDEDAVTAYRERALDLRRFAQLAVTHYLDGGRATI